MRAKPAGEALEGGVRPAMRGARRLTAGLLAAAAAVAGLAAAGQPGRMVSERASSDQVEAAYLYNFGKFVRWPATASQGPMVLCVAGQDMVDQYLTGMVAGEQIEGRAIEVRRLERSEDAGGCSILYLGAGERDRLDAFLEVAAGKPVLTVGESPDFLEHGGIIQFLLAGNHVRFSVNLKAAQRNSLQLSSELLKVAVSVTGQRQSGGLP